MSDLVSQAGGQTSTFDAIDLSPDVRRAIDEIGYKNPTPVQIAVFEPARRGRNLVVQARTGTGKTAAFALPMVDGLVKKGVPGVQGLVLVPTRELALQVAREVERIGVHRQIKVAPIYGGASMERQVTLLQEGAQIVVGTPGRVLDHLRRGTLVPKNIRIFVLDEADEMLSMGFAKELHAIVETLPKDRQGLYFSATIPPDIERLAASHLKDPEYVTLSSDHVGALEVAHYIYTLRGTLDRREALVQILEVEDPESAIIFCNTKDETERLAEMLKRKGFDADWLNGDLEQRERERIMAKTREGRLRFLVATDVAARGIDISHLTHVINADFPEHTESYVHRTGRTGRAGRTGTAISLIGPRDIGNLYLLRLTYKIRPVEKELPNKGDLKTREETDVVEFFVDAFAAREHDPFDLSVARRLLTHDAAESVVAGLLRDHLGPRVRSDVVQGASEARRAKNPAPVPSKPEPEPEPEPETSPFIPPGPTAATPPRAIPDDRPRRDVKVELTREGVPRTLRDGETGRGARPVRGPDRKRRGGMPQAELASWEPASEADDDRPILDRKTLAVPAAPPPRDDAASRPERRHEVVMPGVTVEGEAPADARGRGAGARREDPRRTSTADGQAQIFIGAGRRDGVSTEDVEELLVSKASLSRDDVRQIRLRDRNAFVTIPDARVDDVVRALDGTTFGGRTILVERARARTP